MSELAARVYDVIVVNGSRYNIIKVTNAATSFKVYDYYQRAAWYAELRQNNRRNKRARRHAK